LRPILLKPEPELAETATDVGVSRLTSAPALRLEGAEMESTAPRGVLRRVVSFFSYLASRIFGALTLIVGLSFLASYPVLQIFSLGYLLEAAGRIGRSGRLRDAFPLVPQASRAGGILLGSWFVILPWRYASNAAIDSALLEPASQATWFLESLLPALTVLIPLHILFAILRGGRLRYFLSPHNIVWNPIWLVRRLSRGGYIGKAWQDLVAFGRELRPFHYFYLGFHGGLGALLWLLIPSTLYAVGRSGAASLLGYLGGVLLAIVVLYLPFLQVHYAVENRFGALFEIRRVRERFRHAPIAFLIAFAFTLVLVLPLYLLKVQVVPRDAMWLPALVFIVTIFPLKVLAGWAYGRAGRREQAGKKSWFITRLGCRLLMIPIAAFYALVVFFTQYTGWHGVRALYEHHAFLLPVPF